MMCKKSLEEHTYAEFSKYADRRRELVAQRSSHFDRPVDESKNTQVKLPSPKLGKPRCGRELRKLDNDWSSVARTKHEASPLLKPGEIDA